MTFDEVWEKLKSEDPETFTKAEQLADDLLKELEYAYDQGFNRGYNIGFTQGYYTDGSTGTDMKGDLISRKVLKEACGVWIFHKDYNERKYGCNKCGNLNNIPSNFCPNCGAKMDKILP